MDVDPPPPDPTLVEQPAPETDEPSQLEIIKAEHLRKEIEQEQAVSDALAEVAELKAKLEVEKKKGGDALAEKSGLEQSLQHLQQSHQALQKTLTSETSKASQSQTELASTQNHNKSLLSTIESLQAERDAIKTEVLSARLKVTGWERRVGEIEGELEMRRVEGRNHKFKIEALELNLELANKDNVSLSDSLSRLTSDFAKYRSTSHAQNQTQTLEVQSLQLSLLTAQASLKQLESSSSALQTRLITSQSANAQLRTTVAELKSNFKQEMTAQARMLESAERRSEEGRRRLEEVEREWEDDLERRADAEKRTEREKEMWMAQRVELEGKVSELRETVERLVEASGGGDDGELTQVSFGAAFGGGGDEGGMSLMSPTASLASSLMRKKGQSVTDLYVENVRVKNELVKQEAEVRRLEGCLQEVLRDIQERAPLLKEQRQEYHRLVKTANELANQLSAVTAERDLQSQTVVDLSSKAKQTATTIAEFESHIADLSLQIISLSREIAVRDDPAMLNWQELPVELEEPEGDDMESIISRNLIIFRSIPELQSQNQKLIKIVRELGKKMEAAEAASEDQDNSRMDVETLQAIDEANTLIQSLQQKIIDKDVQMEKFIRERDLFSRMLSQAGVNLPSGAALDDAVAGGAGGAGGLFDVVKANLESYRKELGLDADRLREELSSVTKELNATLGSLARAEAQIGFLNEQAVVLNQSNSLQKVQIEGAFAQNQTIKNDLTRVNMELRSAEDKRIQAEGVAERARTDAATLRAEKELWKTIETRLQADLANLAKERASLQLLTSNLRSVEAESAKVLSDAKERAQATVTSLEADKLNLRTENSRLKEEQTKNLAALTSERETLKTTIETLTAELEANKAAISSERESHEAALRKAFNEEKEKYVNTERRRTSQLLADNKRFISTIKDHEQNKAAQEAAIAQFKTQLVEMEEKLASATTSEDAISNAVNAAVSAKEAELQQAHSEALAAKDKEIQAAKDAASAASQSPSASNVDENIATLTSERDSLVAQLAAEKKAFDEEKAKIVQAERQRVQNVHTDNVNFRRRLAESANKEKESSEKITELETKLAEAEKTASSQPLAEGSTISAPPSEEAIKAAVEAALSSKEAELQIAHAVALASKEQELRAELEKAVADASKASASPLISLTPDPAAAIKAAVSAREAELVTAHEEALKAASSGSDDASLQVKIDEAVAAALARATAEQSMKANAQKTALQREREKKIKAESDLLAVRAELEALQASGSTFAVVSPATVVTSKPTLAGKAPLGKPGKPRNSSISSTASNETPKTDGPAARTRASTTTTVVSPTIKGTAAKDASTGPSIRGAAGIGRGGASTRGARGGRAPTTLFTGALGKAQAGGTGTKRARPEDDSATAASSTGNSLFDRLNDSLQSAGPSTTAPGNKPRQLIKRPKTNNGGSGTSGGAGDESGEQDK